MQIRRILLRFQSGNCGVIKEEKFNELTLYFHCAKEGKKIELIAKNNAVCFEADILSGYVKTERSATADYKSVIGCGYAKQVFGSDAVHGIDLLCRHCGFGNISASDCVLGDIVAVYRIDVESITGKQHFK